MIKVRQATLEDLTWLLEQSRAFDSFYGTAYPIFPADYDAAAKVMTSIIETQVVLIAEKYYPVAPGDHRVTQPVGFIAGALGPHPYNPELTVLSEQFWWVVPEHRGGFAGAKLLLEFMDFGRMHAKWIVMTLESKSPVDAESLERRGFREFERSYLLEIA